MTFRELLGWWMHWGTGRWYAWRGHGSSVPLAPSLPYVPLPFGCSWIESFIINPLTVSKPLSWVLWVVLVNYWAWGEGRGNPQFIASGQKHDGLELAPGTWSGGSPVGLSLLACGIWCQLQVVSVGIEVKWRAPSWCLENWWVWRKNPHSWCQKCYEWK